MLFSGPQYSGKNTAAMELARVLNCQQPQAPWDCSCSSCQAQRQLIHGDTIFLGRSDFSVEVAAALQLFQRRDALASRFMVIRSIRKLLRRFDALLWEGDEKKISKASKPLDELGQFVADIQPGKEWTPKGKDPMASVLKHVADLEKLVPLTVPINQIRRVNNWSHIASQGQHSKKVILLDRADNMQEGARNALLKLLEEPPKDVYLVLISSRKRRILPTILSRLRCYDFAGRDLESAHGVQKRIFKEEEPMDSLSSYFRSLGSGKDIQEGPRKFLLALLEGESYFPHHLFEGMEKDELPLFFQQLLEKLREWLHNPEEGLPSLPLTTLERWNRSISQSYAGMESYNLSGMLLLEDLYYRLRAQR